MRLPSRGTWRRRTAGCGSKSWWKCLRRRDSVGTNKAREFLAALLEVIELIVACRARAEQDDVAGCRDAFGLGDRRSQIAAFVNRRSDMARRFAHQGGDLRPRL